MSGIIEGYNYDIFISYRQKDNKGDRWVSEFVEILKTELESTFKEEISVYFDINPHDGLLETHDVVESLKEKLKCLIFIPIISRTYCDPKSFAWEHEFKAFIEQASKDQYGLKVKLPGGNIASRVLPVYIHDLDTSDIKSCEKVLGGFLRGVEFIYKSSGVNRPLRSKEDNPNDNLNRTFYRDQINKLALAIKEIIRGLRKEPAESFSERKETSLTEDKTPIKGKSIIVLPFENISPDPDQEYFSDGLTEEIITDLSHIHDLLVISRSSAMTYKGTKKKISEIAREVNVHYVLEGSVRKAGNNLRITAQLIDGINDSHIWAEKFSGALDDIFDIQEKVSRAITDALKIKLSPEDKKKLYERSIDNAFAYDRFLRAYSEILSWTKEKISLGLKLMEEGIEITGPNAIIYSGIAFAYFQFANIGLDQEENSRKSEEFVKKALEIDPDLAQAHLVYGNILMLYYGDLRTAINHYKQAYNNNPQSLETIQWLAWGYHLVGKSDLAISFTDQCARLDPLGTLNITMYNGLNSFMKGRFDLALQPLSEIINLSPEASMFQLWKALVLLYNNRIDETIEFINNAVKEPWQDSISGILIFLKYTLKGDAGKMRSLMSDDLIKSLKMDCQYSWHVAAIYSFINDKDKSLEWLENAVNRGFINYSMLNEYDPLLKNIRGDERFKKLMERVKYEWENFEV
jgi:TolB-like protein